MQDLNDKVTGGTLTATEWNEVPSEIQNVIVALGIALSSGDLNQLGKAIAGYVANGAFYTDSGAADAYVLSVIGSKQAPTAYTDGMSITFEVGNDNTGASTVNVAALGVKNLRNADGTVLSSGLLQAGTRVTFLFDSGNDRFAFYNAPSIFSNVFTTGELAISAAGGIGPIAHGFGAAPELFQARVICKIAEQGYSVDDVVIINPAGGDPGTGGTTTDAGIALLVDSTNIAGFFAADSNPIRLFNKSTGVAFSATNANWRLIVKAWR